MEVSFELSLQTSYLMDAIFGLTIVYQSIINVKYLEPTQCLTSTNTSLVLYIFFVFLSFTSTPRVHIR